MSGAQNTMNEKRIYHEEEHQYETSQHHKLKKLSWGGAGGMEVGHVKGLGVKIVLNSSK